MESWNVLDGASDDGGHDERQNAIGLPVAPI